MKIGIDARAAIRYRGTGIGTYAYQLLKNIAFLDRLNQYLLFVPENGSLDIDSGDNFRFLKVLDNNKDNFWEEMDSSISILGNDIFRSGMDIYYLPQNGIGLPLKKNSRYVITLHDVIPYKLPETVGPQYLKIYLKEVPEILPLCDGIITVSEHSKNDICKTLGFPEDKVYVTYLAPEDIYYPRDKAECSAILREKYGIEDKFILYVGGFSPRKNIKGLISAFGKIKEKYKDLKLVILGKKGRSYYDYRDLSYNLNLKDDVLFPGYIPLEDLPIFYNAAYIFCYPSFYEGFGLPPIEAMACGTPTISSNLTSIPEVVGDSSLLVNPYDIDDMADKITMLLEDEKLYEEYIFKGLLRSFSFSWKKTAAETLKIFKTIGDS